MSEQPRTGRWFPVTVWAVTASAVTAVRYLASVQSPTSDGVWIRVDGGAYLAIATEGYTYSPKIAHPLVAWFPGYPLTVRTIDRLADGRLGGPIGVSVIVSFVAGLAAALLFWEWTSRRLTDRERKVSTGVLLLYAYGWYLYGAVYSDAMFLAVALAAFVAADRGRWPLAVFLAGAASAVRPVGVAVGIGIVIAMVEREGAPSIQASVRGPAMWYQLARWYVRRLRCTHLASLLAAWWGVIAYSVYLARRWGQPLLWAGVQEQWSQGPSGGPMTWFKLHMAARMIRIHEADYIASNLAQLAILGAVVALIPTTVRRLGTAAGAYVIVIVAMLLFGTNDLVGAGRYALALFPAAAALGTWLAPRRSATLGHLVVSAVCLLALTALFARGAYLS